MGISPSFGLPRRRRRRRRTRRVFVSSERPIFHHSLPTRTIGNEKEESEERRLSGRRVACTTIDTGSRFDEISVGTASLYSSLIALKISGERKKPLKGGDANAYRYGTGIIRHFDLWSQILTRPPLAVLAPVSWHVCIYVPMHHLLYIPYPMYPGLIGVDVVKNPLVPHIIIIIISYQGPVPVSSYTPPPFSSIIMDAWWSWFTNLQDDQRIERLQRCQEIHTVLVQCQVQQQKVQQQQQHPRSTKTPTTPTTTSSTESNYYDPMSIESFSGGIRTMKYFGWRGILQPPQQAQLQAQQQQPQQQDEPQPQEQQQQQQQMSERVKTAIVHSCSREQHALWACRAVAVGCGKELGSLKAGFDQVGPWNVLFEPQTAYETSTQNKTTSKNTVDPHARIPCADLQSSLGTCVQRGADALLERTQRRDKAKGVEPLAAANVESE